MKPARAKPHRKPFSESHQTIIACTAFCAVVAGIVYVLGYIFPAAPVQSAMVIPAADPAKPVNPKIRGPR